MDVESLSDGDFRQLILRVEDDKRRREAESARLLAENNASLLYHRELSEVVEKVRGLPTWQRPAVAVTGYPSGFAVWHEGYGWQNSSASVALLEPGSPDSGWVTFEEAGIGYPDEVLPDPEVEPEEEEEEHYPSEDEILADPLLGRIVLDGSADTL